MLVHEFQTNLFVSVFMPYFLLVKLAAGVIYFFVLTHFTCTHTKKIVTFTKLHNLFITETQLLAPCIWYHLNDTNYIPLDVHVDGRQVSAIFLTCAQNHHKCCTHNYCIKKLKIDAHN